MSNIFEISDPNSMSKDFFFQHKRTSITEMINVTQSTNSKIRVNSQFNHVLGFKLLFQASEYIQLAPMDGSLEKENSWIFFISLNHENIKKCSWDKYEVFGKVGENNKSYPMMKYLILNISAIYVSREPD